LPETSLRARRSASRACLRPFYSGLCSQRPWNYPFRLGSQDKRKPGPNVPAGLAKMRAENRRPQ
jgi:hypothetical protein